MSDKNEAHRGTQTSKNQFPPNAPDLKICQQYCAALNGAKGAEWCGRWLSGDYCHFDKKQQAKLTGQVRFSREG